MSVIIESGKAELALGELRTEMGKPANSLERLFMLVDGEVDYTKDMRAMTPTGNYPRGPSCATTPPVVSVLPTWSQSTAPTMISEI